MRLLLLHLRSVLIVMLAGRPEGAQPFKLVPWVHSQLVPTGRLSRHHRSLWRSLLSNAVQEPGRAFATFIAKVCVVYRPHPLRHVLQVVAHAVRPLFACAAATTVAKVLPIVCKVAVCNLSFARCCAAIRSLETTFFCLADRHTTTIN